MSTLNSNKQVSLGQLEKHTTRQGFFFMEIMVALLLALILTTVAFRYVTLIIRWRQELWVKTQIIEAFHSRLAQAAAYPSDAAHKASHQKKYSWGTLSWKSLAPNVHPHLPFIIKEPLKYYHFIEVTAHWNDSVQHDHFLTCVGGGWRS